VALPQLGPFNLVTAVYLLNYAASKTRCWVCAEAPSQPGVGGRFVVYTVNPAFTSASPTARSTGSRAAPDARGGSVHVRPRVVTDPPTPYSTPSGTRQRMSGR